MNIIEFRAAYIEAALWSSTYGANGENSMDDGEHKLAAETINVMHIDCDRFIATAADTLDQLEGSDFYRDGEYEWAEMAGHDFWLTRCGHGVGFWDRGIGELGVELSTICESFGNVDLYIGDDGLIYC